MKLFKNLIIIFFLLVFIKKFEVKLLEIQFCVGEEYFTFHLYEGQIKRLISREDYGIDILYN